jgi:SEC-C motif domain protein
VEEHQTTSQPTSQLDGADPCPCSAGRSYDECCGPVLRGDAKAETAEALMRARYTAYTQGEIEFIVDSHDPESSEQVDREASASWSKKAEWLGLEIVSTEAGGSDDESGGVEFIARYRMEGADLAHHERAEFRRGQDGWVYVDGEMVKPKPVVREQPKVGRNEPCPCGSGKKYKKCCAAA